MNRIIGTALIIFGFVLTIQGFSSFSFFVLPVGLLLTYTGYRMLQQNKKSLLKKAGSALNKDFTIDEKFITRLATRMGGVLSVNDVVKQTSLNEVEAKEILEKMHEQGLAEILLTEQGNILYRFLNIPPSLSDRGTGKPII